MKLPLVPADDDRAKKWEAKSLNLVWIDGRFPAIVRSLGRLDSFLRHEDAKAVGVHGREEILDVNVIEDYLALSQLWIFGGYELLRTLHETLKAGIPNISQEAHERMKELKDKFERIRVPLAKHEPARVHVTVDSLPKGAAVLARAKDKGWFWQLNETTRVWRRDLADELLSALDLFPDPLKKKITF